MNHKQLQEMKRIYLDNGATTQVDPLVASEIQKYFLDTYGNASSNHIFGEQACFGLERARITIAKALNADTDEIYFTSGGTESDNLALRGVWLANKEKGNHIITTNIEHPAIMRTCENLEKEGVQVTYLKVDSNGLINLDELKSAITPKTILISVMAANNEIGTIQNIKEIGDCCRSRNVLFHTDAVQAFTKVFLDTKSQNIDLISMSGHKIHGPKGIGAIFIKKGTSISPIIFGGSQQKKIRPGTENIPGIVGFAKAVEIAQREGNAGIEKTAKLRDKLISGVLSIKNTRLNGHPTQRLCINVNISFEEIDGESLLAELNKNGIACSTGSACSAKSSKPSHVLSAIGLDHKKYPASIRFTLSRFTSEDEIDYAVKVVNEIVPKLRENFLKGIKQGC